MSARASTPTGHGSHPIVFPVEAVEGRVRRLKWRLALLAFRTRDPRVARAASRLLVSLTELMEDLEESVDPVLVLRRLHALEAEAESLLARPELAWRR